MNGWMVGWRPRYVDVIFEQIPRIRTSMAVQWLRLHLPTQGFRFDPCLELGFDMPHGQKNKICTEAIFNK